MRLLLRTPEVAALLAMSVESFYRRRAALDAAGFPKPVPGMGVRYDPLAIQEWLAAQRTRPGATTPPLDDVAGWQAELDRRLG
jgi:predicted DNA-binding transcriptional regulator AlpA